MGSDQDRLGLFRRDQFAFNYSRLCSTVRDNMVRVYDKRVSDYKQYRPDRQSATWAELWMGSKVGVGRETFLPIHHDKPGNYK